MAQPQPHFLHPTNNAYLSDNDDTENHASFFKEMRGNLMIVAILAAGLTYQAGLNPPGGDWQDDQGHKAGTPILHDKFFDRYQTFFYCNAISFLSSLVVIILLMNKHFYHDMKKVKAVVIILLMNKHFYRDMKKVKAVVIILLMNKHFYRDMKKVKALEITMVLDLFSFMAAYAAGSCRRISSSIYVFLLMGAVFIYVLTLAWHHSVLRAIANRFPEHFPSIRNRT